MHLQNKILCLDLIQNTEILGCKNMILKPSLILHKKCKGNNRISFSITKDVNDPIFQIDIQQPMKVSNVMSDFEITSQKRDGNFLFIQTKGSFKKVTITLSVWILKEILLLLKEHHGMVAGFSLRTLPANHG